MSQRLRQLRFHLGTRLRMQACQSAERMGPFAAADAAPLLYRAVLQAHRDALALPPDGESRVGRIRHPSSFAAYVRKAAARLGRPVAASDAMLEAMYASHAALLRPLALVVRLRAVFAQCIESIIVLDRHVFLLEGGDACATECVFDASQSPRCFAHTGHRP